MNRQIQALGLALALLNLTVFTAPVQAATVEDLERRIEEMQKSHDWEMAQLREEIARMKKPAPAQPPVTAPETSPAQSFPAKRIGGRAALPPAFGGVYDKPFLKRFGRNTYLGGYMDVIYKDTEDTGRTFDQARLIPFIYSDVTENIKFATEIEFEHGGTNNSQADGEVKVEFATIDYLIKEWANLRAGILLSPLGRLNAVHDSPLQDLTERPLVDTNIIPTTLSESGAGMYGSFYPTETSKLDYELYAVNGFTGAGNTGSAITSKINVSSGVRSARGSQRTDNNDNLSLVGRLAYSPWLGAEVGASAHHGAYSNDANLDLSIYGLDWTFQKGPFEFLGEYAFAQIERNDSIHAYNATTAASATSTARIPGHLEGYYLQTNYHFMPPALRRWFPRHFKEESTFTLVGRWDQIDLNGGEEDSLVGERDRLTLGLNFRPVEDTVLKFDYQFNNGNIASDDRDAFLISAATYF